MHVRDIVEGGQPFAGQLAGNESAFGRRSSHTRSWFPSVSFKLVYKLVSKTRIAGFIP